MFDKTTLTFSKFDVIIRVMIIEKDCNLLEEPLDGFFHQANCFTCFGGGIAYRIKQKFPEAFEADLKTKCGDREKLGTFSLTVLPNNNLHIFNLYSQYDHGFGERHTSYDAIADGLPKIEKYAIEHGLKTLGMPCRMGSVLGGGSWRIVKSIVQDVFEASELTLYICNYEK